MLKARKAQKFGRHVTLRERELESGNVQVYIDIYRRGEKRRTEAVGILTKENPLDHQNTRIFGEELALKISQEMQYAQEGLSGAHSRKRNVAQFLRDQSKQRTADNTRSSWESAIEHWTAFAGEGIVFGELNPQLFERFKSYLLKEVNPNSAQIYMGRIKTALYQAVRENIIPRNPAVAVTIKGKRTLPVTLSLKEIRKLADAPCPNDQVKQAFLFSCFTGLRYSDVDRLTWDQIVDGFLEYTQKKTGEAERLPLSEEAQKILKRQKRSKQSPNIQRELLPNIVFYLPSQPVVDKQLKQWAKKAGISKKVSFHKSRHTFATLHLNAGTDLYTVSKLLGHRNIASTQIYAQVVDEKKVRAMKKLPRLR